MTRILIFGNSGSGKSTLAKKLCASRGLAHLDLDTFAWMPTSPPARRSVLDSEADITEFIHANPSWVIEGCYTDLLELAAPQSDEMIFMNLPVDTCIENARSRPWEPHKYETKDAQDANLAMLIAWIAEYPIRVDTFSESAHMKLYENYSRTKRLFTANE